MNPATQVVIVGRVLADLYPMQIETPLEDVQTFERFVGGYGGNVGIGLARLGVRTAVVSGVGDDGHGRFITRTLASEGVDVRWIEVHPTLRTALAFCEIWPPERFPLTAYRFPSCPDQEIRPESMPLDVIRDATVVVVSGTALAHEPSRSAAMAVLEARRRASQHGATILDLDWRPGYWSHPDAYPDCIRLASTFVDTLIGSDDEFAAAGVDPASSVASGIGRVLLKHGSRGASMFTADDRFDVGALPVTVVNALGAGDAFAAAAIEGVVAERPAMELLTRAAAAGGIVASRLACSAAMPSAQELAESASTLAERS